MNWNSTQFSVSKQCNYLENRLQSKEVLSEANVTALYFVQIVLENCIQLQFYTKEIHLRHKFKSYKRPTIAWFLSSIYNIFKRNWWHISKNGIIFTLLTEGIIHMCFMVYPPENRLITKVRKEKEQKSFIYWFPKLELIARRNNMKIETFTNCCTDGWPCPLRAQTLMLQSPRQCQVPAIPFLLDFIFVQSKSLKSWK